MRRIQWAERPRRRLLRLRGADEPRDAGAAAVEFALVLPILVLILFGIIDYGLYFNASLQSRWGVHDAARAAVVVPASGTSTCEPAIQSAPADIMRLVCAVVANTNSATAKKYVAVHLPDGWVVGKQLVVCERLDVQGLTGFVPFPRKGHIRDIAVLTIEQPDPDPALAATNAPLSYEDTLPATTNWSWCKP